MVGQVGLEPTTALSTGFTVRGGTSYTVLTHFLVVIRAGLEPSITALKGLCPDRLDERTRFAGSCLPASGMRCYKYIVYEHIEECCKND